MVTSLAFKLILANSDETIDLEVTKKNLVSPTCFI